MSKQVVILSGVSGSGKSTLVKEFGPEVSYYRKVVSADNFFMVNGEYKFSPAHLGDAHADCFRKFIQAMQDETQMIIVDNTNTTAEEISPYMLGAAAFGYEVEVQTILPKNMTDLELCAQRNAHGVPMAVISAQYRRLCERKLPRYWKASTREMKG